jgi:hypothetical protein
VAPGWGTIPLMGSFNGCCNSIICSFPSYYSRTL